MQSKPLAGAVVSYNNHLRRVVRNKNLYSNPQKEDKIVR
jgi:hypothetical protein